MRSATLLKDFDWDNLCPPHRSCTVKRSPNVLLGAIATMYLADCSQRLLAFSSKIGSFSETATCSSTRPTTSSGFARRRRQQSCRRAQRHRIDSQPSVRDRLPQQQAICYRAVAKESTDGKVFLGGELLSNKNSTMSKKLTGSLLEKHM